MAVGQTGFSDLHGLECKPSFEVMVTVVRLLPPGICSSPQGKTCCLGEVQGREG